MLINRIEFIKKVIRYLLLGLLVIIGVIGGKKVVTGSSCTSCPGKGICRGETDCSTYLSE
jgi:hypothetical protein